MHTTMKENGQIKCSTDDNRLPLGSTESYLVKTKSRLHNVLYVVNQTTIQQTVWSLFCNFCNKKGHSAKGFRCRMNGHTICIHCGLDHGHEPCPQSHQNNKDDVRTSWEPVGSGQQVPWLNSTPRYPMVLIYTCQLAQAKPQNKRIIELEYSQWKTIKITALTDQAHHLDHQTLLTLSHKTKQQSTNLWKYKLNKEKLSRLWQK